MTRKPNRPYYTLLICREDECDGKWQIAFGSYDVHEANEEKAEYVNGGYGMKVIRTGDAQGDIDAAVALLNGEVPVAG